MVSRLLLAVVGIYCATWLQVASLGIEKFENPDGSRESWGYVKVRPGANMFWWLHYTTASPVYHEKPLVMWLLGGPGLSPSGIGNFVQIGPLHLNLTRRKDAWHHHVNLLMVDTPVGTGFSYVDAPWLLNTDNRQTVDDLLKMFSTFLATHPEFQTSPFYIFAHAYGARMAALLALELHKRIQSGEMSCNLKGVSMGGPWISPADSVLSWGPYLYSMGYVDRDGLARINRHTRLAKQAVDLGLGTIATTIWNITQGLMRSETDGVDLLNVMYPLLPPRIVDRGEDRELVSIEDISSQMSIEAKAQFLGTPQLENTLTEIAALLNERIVIFGSDLRNFNLNDLNLRPLMNGNAIRNKLRIIPKNVLWGAQFMPTIQAMAEDYMKPMVDVVEELLNNTPIKVMIFSAQFDILHGTLGTLQWVHKLKWDGINEWKIAPKTTILINGTGEMYERSHGNLSFYWILRSGHFVPEDVPVTAVEMMKCMTKIKNCGGN